MHLLMKSILRKINVDLASRVLHQTWVEKFHTPKIDVQQAIQSGVALRAAVF